MNHPFVYLAILLLFHLSGGYTDADLQSIIDTAAADQGVSAPLMECIGALESTGTLGHYDAYAMSPTDDFGLMQFHYDGGIGLFWAVPDDIASGSFMHMALNPVIAAESASYLVAHGYGPRWSVWPLCQ